MKIDKDYIKKVLEQKLGHDISGITIEPATFTYRDTPVYGTVVKNNKVHNQFYFGQVSVSVWNGGGLDGFNLMLNDEKVLALLSKTGLSQSLSLLNFQNMLFSHYESLFSQVYVSENSSLNFIGYRIKIS